MAKKTDKTEAQLAAVEETLGRTEQWIENNSKTLSTAVFVIVAAIALFLLRQILFRTPKQQSTC